MDSGRWQRIEELFEEALRLPPEARSAFLEAACGEDASLREEVEALIAADPLAESYLNRFEAEHVAPSFADAIAGRDPLIGARLGPYEVEERIGRGGMGTVYRASRADGAFEQRVALKVVRQDLGPEHTARFFAERRILARLAHPNIARIYDGGVAEDGRPWLAMEYVDGISVTQYADEHRLSVNERLALFRSICAAVAYAHQNLVVHRDLKPSNILISPAGEVKLLDFGIARLMEEGDEVPLTLTGTGPLTPEYAAPEQVRGDVITVTTDVYALGVLLYELLTGRRPYRIPSRVRHEVERAILEEEPTRPSTAVEQPLPAGASGAADTTPETLSEMRKADPHTLRRRLSGDLDVIVLKALRKEPDQRYGSAIALSEDVERHLDGMPVAARPPTAAYRTSRFVRRHRFGVTAAVAIFLLLLVYAFTVSHQSEVIADERDRAAAEAQKAAEVADFLVGLFVANRPDISLGEIPTARDLLERGASRAADLTSQPEVRAELLAVIGRAYLQLGLHGEADSLLSQALKAHLGLYGAAHPSTANVYNNIGSLRYDQGDFDGAMEMMLLAVDSHELAGSEPSIAAVPLANVGAIARMRGDLPDAVRHFTRAAELYRASGRTDEHNYFGILTGLGLAHRQLEDFDRAEAVYNEAIRGLRASGIDRHPELATALNNLGMLYVTLGNADDARPLIEEAYAMRLQVFGKEHAYTAELVANLGLVEYQLGRLDVAAALLEEAVATTTRNHGSDHVRVGIALKNLGDCVRDAGESRTALDHYQRALEIFRAGLPEGHDRSSGALLGLAEAHLRLDEVEAAEAAARESLNGYLARHGPEAIAVAHAQRQLAAVFLRQSNFGEAEALLLASRETLEARHGSKHADTQQVYRLLADLYRQVGDPGQEATFLSYLPGRN